VRHFIQNKWKSTNIANNWTKPMVNHFDPDKPGVVGPFEISFSGLEWSA
jgi:hypothetical protein